MYSSRGYRIRLDSRANALGGLGYAGMEQLDEPMLLVVDREEYRRNRLMDKSLRLQEFAFGMSDSLLFRKIVVY